MDWIPVVVAAIAAIAAFGVQFLVSRGEPAALKRLLALNQAIEGMPHGDKGRAQLELARTRIALKLGSSLIGARGFARVLWIAGLIGAIGGSLLLVTWLAFVVSNPTLGAAPPASSLGNVALILIVVAPALLVYSKLWPGFESDFKELTGIFADRRASKRSGRIVDADPRTPSGDSEG